MAETVEGSVAPAGEFRRQMILALALAAVVVAIRGVLIVRAQSPCIDDNYHLYRGLLFLRGDFATLRHVSLNDPPLGEALSAVPAWWNGVHLPDPLLADLASTMLPTPANLSFELPESVRIETVVWKGLLFLPMVAVVFAWTWQLYGKWAAWLSTVLLLAEPTIAAHLPLPTVDVLGMEGIVIGTWAAWRFVQRPTVLRGAGAAIAIAAAMLIKHTAVILPVLLLILAAIQWLVREKLREEKLERRVGVLTAELVAIVLVMWALMQFQMSRVDDLPLGSRVPLPTSVSHRNLPMMIYLSSLEAAKIHVDYGHLGYLFGETRYTGWWYYQPVVATFKVPLGIALVFLAALVSLIFRGPRYEELPLLIGACLWITALSLQHIDIGFRHFLPPYAFLLILSCRALSGAGRAIAVAACAGAAAAFIHCALWTPDQLSYINFPRKAAYLSISDSNVDWGQGLKQIGAWIDRQPDDGRPIYVGYFGPPSNLYEKLGPRLTGYSHLLNWMPSPSGQVVQGKMPDKGWLLLSPVILTGQYDRTDRFARLRKVPPRQVLGHSILVYDLDQLE